MGATGSILSAPRMFAGRDGSEGIHDGAGLARSMSEPFHKLKYAFAATYYDQMLNAVPKLVKEKGAKKVCSMYQDDEFGLEVLRGAEAGLKTINMEMAEKTSFKRGATDFSSQVAKLKSSGCDMVVLGTIIRETIGAIGEARRR